MIIGPARHRLLILLAVLAASACARDSVTTVAMTLGTIDPSGDGHYELFAVVHDSAASVVRFEVVELVEGTWKHKEVLDHRDTSTVLGTVDGADRFGRPIGGVRFRTRIDLTDATHLFITREADGDTDPTPSRDVFAGCALSAGARGTLTCRLASPDDKEVGRGTATLVLPDDGINEL